MFDKFNPVEISIILPTYNRSELFKNCILSIMNQTCLKNKYEVIAVNDGSYDATEKVVESFLKFPNFKYFYQENRGPAAARNLGIKNAQGEILVFIDDDCIAEENLVTNIIRVFQLYPDADILQGTILSVNSDIISIAASCTIDAYIYKQEKLPEDQCFRRHCITMGVAMRKKIFQELGYFNESFRRCSDADFDYRVRLNKRRILFAPEVVIKHYYRSNLKSLLIREFNIGCYKHHLTLKWRHWYSYKDKIEEIKSWPLIFKGTATKYGLTKTILIILNFLLQKFSYILGYNSERLRYAWRCLCDAGRNLALSNHTRNVN